MKFIEDQSVIINTDKKWYSPGDKIIGIVNFILHNKIKLKSFTVTISGTIHSKSGSSLTSRFEDASNREGDQANQECSPTEIYKDITQFCNFVQGDNEFKAGHHEYPLEFDLPEQLPSSFKSYFQDQNGLDSLIKIQYFLEVEMLFYTPFSFKNKKEVFVYEASSLLDRNNMPSPYSPNIKPSQKICCLKSRSILCCMQAGVIIIEPRLSKPYYFTDEYIEIQCNIYSENGATITKIYGELQQSITQISDTGKSKTTKTISEESDNNNKGIVYRKGTYEDLKINVMKIPGGLIPQIHENSVVVSYKLKIIFETTYFMKVKDCNPEINLDILIYRNRDDNRTCKGSYNDNPIFTKRYSRRESQQLNSSSKSISKFPRLSPQVSLKVDSERNTSYLKKLSIFSDKTISLNRRKSVNNHPPTGVNLQPDVNKPSHFSQLTASRHQMTSLDKSHTLKEFSFKPNCDNSEEQDKEVHEKKTCSDLKRENNGFNKFPKLTASNSTKSSYANSSEEDIHGARQRKRSRFSIYIDENQQALCNIDDSIKMQKNYPGKTNNISKFKKNSLSDSVPNIEAFNTNYTPPDGYQFSKSFAPKSKNEQLELDQLGYKQPNIDSSIIDKIEPGDIMINQNRQSGIDANNDFFKENDQDNIDSLFFKGKKVGRRNQEKSKQKTMISIDPIIEVADSKSIVESVTFFI